jgi:protein O-GlcNAc transferase
MLRAAALGLGLLLLGALGLEEEALRGGWELQRAGDLEGAAAVYSRVLEEGGATPDALKLLGALRFAESTRSLREAEDLLRRAGVQGGGSDVSIALAEVLKAQGRLQDAESLLRSVMAQQGAADGDSQRAALNLSFILQQAGRPERERLELLSWIRHSAPGTAWEAQALVQLGFARSSVGDWEGALEMHREARRIVPSDETAGLQMAVAAHHLGRIEEATVMYGDLLREGQGGFVALSNLGAALHQQGRSLEAMELFDQALEIIPGDPSTLNNYGCALQVLGRHDQAAQKFRAVLSVGNDAEVRSALINLGTHLAEEGEAEAARDAFQRAHLISPDPALPIRQALIFSPVVQSVEEYANERRYALESLESLLASHRGCRVEDSRPTAAVPADRVQFYLAYNGVNNRDLQEMISALYALERSWLRDDLVEGRAQTSLIRVGFASKYFGSMEPHGMLLEGIVRGLPRSLFWVVVCPVPGGDGTPIAEGMARAADELRPLSLSLAESRSTLAGLNLDVLIYADLTSEPVSHFLAHARLAPVQVAFWGNPITSGSPSIDYFVSGDRLESPHRTRLGAPEQEPYTEQVVLLGGSGIWYDPPPPGSLPPLASVQSFREVAGVPPGACLLMCAQSSYKLHPLFDEAVVGVLRAAPDSHLVLLEGRRAAWTRAVRQRLERRAPEVLHRIHWIPRVSSEDYLELVAAADVVLHPFPFGGSRTSADAIAVGTPLVAMATDALSGRMAASLLVSMGPELVSCCVAQSLEQYVSLAASLATDAVHRSTVRLLLEGRSSRIWQDSEVLRDWARFLLRAADVADPAQQLVAQELLRDWEHAQQ